MADWKKALVGLGAAAGACAVVYFLLQRGRKDAKLSTAGADASSSSQRKVQANKSLTKGEITKILDEILKCQLEMKAKMADIIAELKSSSMTFEETYKKIQVVKPQDPLEKAGLTPSELDDVLHVHQSDPQVKNYVKQIMGTSDSPADKEKNITVKTVLDIHKFMLDELHSIAKYYNALPDKFKFDGKTVAVTVQAIVGAKFESKFRVTAEDIERAVMSFHDVLAGNQEFTNLNTEIQQVMAGFMKPKA
eukprot:TRINITY_DN125671_c0_g1_i1.p1 TRINITY_DN125671_c0_g1~~TRINITY_DN125671_c0_g1_i1.p1  ORF type:complete len:249 (-),score=73.35 TRINITY_DN125671_c0_g1_i1:110-856(-)